MKTLSILYKSGKKETFNNVSKVEQNFSAKIITIYYDDEQPKETFSLDFVYTIKVS